MAEEFSLIDATFGTFDSAVFGGIRMTPRRTVPRYEVEYFLGGSGESFLDGKGYPVKEGSILIARPGSVRWSKLPFRAVYFKFDATGRIAGALDRMPAVFTPPHPERVRDALFDLIREGEAPLRAKGRAYLFFDVLFAEAGRSDAPPPDPVLRSAMHYLREHFSEKVTLSDIARNVGLSPNYFHTLFTEKTGKTPGGVLREIRISEAKRLLSDPRLSVAEVAFSTGFGTQSYFDRAFLSATGITPREYRKRLGEAYWKI